MLSFATGEHLLSRWLGQTINDDRPVLLRYATSVASVAAALLLASLIPYPADPSHFTLFFAAVMFSAWYGGLGAGLIATLLSALSLDYFFITPVKSIHLDWPALLRLSVFLIVALVTSYLTTSRRRAENALRKAQAELEGRVQKRTAELAKANEALRSEIVERTKTETELLHLQHEMGRVERLATLGRMTGAIAHDLGTPLNSVLGYTQLLSQEDLPERARRRLEIIETQIHRIGGIIQSYLAHARVTQPRSQVNLNDLIQETLLLQPIFHQRRLEVSTALAESLPTVDGDFASLQRVLINLLDNAVDTDKEGGLLKITTLPAASKKAGVTVEITDSGSGIPAELLPRIFDLFVTTKSPGEGTGMGLVICQEIINAHGGAIQISSQVGRGTTFSIYLPSHSRSADVALVANAK